MFSNMNKPPFGAASSSGFGFSTNTPTNTNLFGQNQQSTLFGKPAAAFGGPSTSTFGQPQTNTLFPQQQQQQPSLFNNANNTFGPAPTTQSGFGGGGIFGQQPSTSGLFSSSSTFGQQNKPAAFGFGQQQTQPVLFGQQAQTTGASNLFQAQPSALFGGGTSGFGNQQAGTVIKFTPVTGTDTMAKNGQTQSINTKHHSITCMKEYEHKSFEELRWEDYQGNRKGPQQSSGFGATAFGAPASSAPSLFGQPDQTKPAFGQSPSVFGQNTSTFPQLSTGFGMGAQQNNSNNLFAKPTGFGTLTSTAPTAFSGFGTSTQASNPFGAAQQTKPFSSTPVFGAAQTSQPSTGFGTTGGLFGSQPAQNQSTGIFGKPAQPATGFGAMGQTGFGMSQPTSSVPSATLFTANKPLFGPTSTPSTGFGLGTFGQTNSSSFSNLGKPSFGTGLTTNTGFGTSFGTTQPGTGLFGNTAKPDGGGLFGNTSSTGLFGNTTTNFQGTPGFALGANASNDTLFPQNQANLSAGNLALLTSDPFGEAPHLAGLEPKIKSSNNSSVATNPSELKSLLDSSKKVDLSHSPRLKVYPKGRKDSLFDGLQKQEGDTQDFHKKSVRRLVVKPKIPDNPDLLRDEILNVITSPDSSQNLNSNDVNKENDQSITSPNVEKKTTPLQLNFETSINEDYQNNSIGLQNSSLIKGNMSGNKSSFLSQHDMNEEEKDPLASGDNVNRHVTGIISTRPEYFIKPDLDELAQYVDENGSCFVKGFTIGRRGYGNVCYPDEMDVANLNIDQIVQFRYREINVYPDENKKPSVGHGLNRRAQVTLDNIYPKRSGTNQLIEDIAELVQMNFAEKLRKVTVKKNAKFVDYRPETGSWVFKVDHFSKYGFNDSDEETDTNGEGTKHKKDVPKETVDVSQKNKDKAKNWLNMDAVKQLQKRSLVLDDEDMSREGTKYGLENDIYIDDDHSNEDDLLQQSMLVDMHEDNYHHIPPEIPDMHIPFDNYRASKNIQLMKSTLFAEDDRSSEASSHVSIIRQYHDIEEELPTMIPPVREEIVIRKRVVIRPKVMKVYNYKGEDKIPEILPMSYMDMSIFKGKSFKCGWSKGFTFGHVNTKGNITGEINLSTLKLGSINGFDPLDDCLIDSLQTVLQESEFVLSPDNIPTFKIVKGHSYLLKQRETFEKLSLKYNSPESQYLHSIWTLCVALWGPAENTPYNRRYLLSEWLKVYTNHTDESHKNVILLAPEEKTQTIFNLLSVFKIFEAANMAMENQFPQLSLLVSQLSLTNKTKLFMQEQIESWYNSLAANHISHEMKKIYLLLSGIPSKEDVNIFEDVDWKRAFAMHLWYIVPNGGPIEMAIELYKNAFEKIGYSQKPLPPYCKQFTEENSFDILYHILLIYQSGIHRLSQTLNPSTHTDDPLDYRLSWLLLQLFLSLERGLLDIPENIKICTSFSNQLEELGNWEWAIFVLLFIEDNFTKKKLIMDILDRNLSPETDKASLDVQNNLVNNMNIPSAWIHLVKGQKTRSLGRYFEAFNNFALAEEYGQANDIFVDHILPGLFINEQYDIIRMLIEELRNGEKYILKWNHEAGLVNDFLGLQDKVITFRQDELFKLQVKLNSISERLTYFPLKTDQQRLCIAEMSKRCSSIYKELAKKSTTSPTSTFSQFVECLVMPPDYKQDEALFLINDLFV